MQGGVHPLVYVSYAWRSRTPHGPADGARSLLRIDRPKPLQIRAKIRPNPNDSKRSGR
jgi:hypothetical protein